MTTPNTNLSKPPAEKQTAIRLPPPDAPIGSMETFRGAMTAMKDQLALALPRHMNPDRMIRVASTAIQRNPALLECTTHSLLGSLIQCAQLGLEPDGVLGYAYLVPFRNSRSGRRECQLITGYKGKVDLAFRSGRIKEIRVRSVFKGDAFVYEDGLRPILKHKPKEGNRQPADLTYVYAIASTNNGGQPYVVLDRAMVEKARGMSKSGGDGPWQTHYVEMAEKTAVHRLCKMLPLSPEVQRQFSEEDLHEAGIPIDGAEFIAVPEGGKADALIAAMDAGNGSEPPTAPKPVQSPPDVQAAAKVQTPSAASMPDTGEKPPERKAQPSGPEAVAAGEQTPIDGQDEKRLTDACSETGLPVKDIYRQLGFEQGNGFMETCTKEQLEMDLLRIKALGLMAKKLGPQVVNADIEQEGSAFLDWTEVQLKAKVKELESMPGRRGRPPGPRKETVEQTRAF